MVTYLSQVIEAVAPEMNGRQFEIFSQLVESAAEDILAAGNYADVPSEKMDVYYNVAKAIIDRGIDVSVVGNAPSNEKANAFIQEKLIEVKTRGDEIHRSAWKLNTPQQ